MRTTKELNTKNKIPKSSNGITLIALVITIIVMLILVAVTITMAVNGGLFDYARRAGQETNRAIDAEQQLGTGTIVEQHLYGISEEVAKLPEYSESLLDEDTGVLTTNTKYIDNNKQVAVIPRGFKLLTNIEDEIDKGIVITDEVDSNGNSIGNEFVWVPVAKGTFERTEWENNEPTGSISSDYIENAENDPTGKYTNMVNSVNDFGGFYIGRYEAGSNENRTITTKDETVLVQKGAFPYNCVVWAKGLSDYENTFKVGSANGIKDYGHGPVYLCLHMYDGRNVGVTSTLCYGVQWDATLKFIKDKVNVTNSTNWGNHSSNSVTFSGGFSLDQGKNWSSGSTVKPAGSPYLLKTGVSEENKAKNIYDLAGNLREWTMEYKSSGKRVARGESFYYSYVDGNHRASHREAFSPTESYTYYFYSFGFRPTLYVNEDVSG